MFLLKCKASFSEAKTKIRSNIRKLGIILDFLFFVVSSEQFAALLFFLFALLMFHKSQIRPVHHKL